MVPCWKRQNSEIDPVLLSGVPADWKICSYWWRSQYSCLRLAGLN